MAKQPMHPKFIERMELVREETTRDILVVLDTRHDVRQRIRTLFLSARNCYELGEILADDPDLAQARPDFDLCSGTWAGIGLMVEKAVLTAEEIRLRHNATLDTVSAEARLRMHKRLSQQGIPMLTTEDRIDVLRLAVECRTGDRQRTDLSLLSERLQAHFQRTFTKEQARAALKNSLRLWRNGKLSLTAEVARAYTMKETTGEPTLALPS